MSLILDALRKSEAERRRGNLPALALELPPPPPTALPTRAWWLALPVTIVLAALAFWMTRPGDLPAPAVQPTVLAPVPSIAAPQAARATPDRPVEAPAATREPEPSPPLPAVSTPGSEPEPVPAPADGMPGSNGPTRAPVLALADLTPDERRALPPLQLSMHMWSAAPADRFVILDGRRLGEGDRAGSAVVARIDPDGVILAADGRRIRLPLP